MEQVDDVAISSDIVNSKSGDASNDYESQKKPESSYNKNIYIKEDPEGINIRKSDIML